VTLGPASSHSLVLRMSASQVADEDEVVDGCSVLARCLGECTAHQSTNSNHRRGRRIKLRRAGNEKFYFGQK
jgi:hypothetical protein